MLIMLKNNIAKKNDNQLVEFSANGEKKLNYLQLS